MNFKSTKTAWSAIKPLSGKRSERIFPFVSFVLMSAIIRVCNAVINMRGEGDIEVVRAENGIVITNKKKSMESDGLQTRWLKVCKDGDEYWIKVRCSQLYTVDPDTGDPGTVISGEPFTTFPTT